MDEIKEMKIQQDVELTKLKLCIKRLLDADADNFIELVDGLLTAYTIKKRRTEQSLVEKIIESTFSC